MKKTDSNKKKGKMAALNDLRDMASKMMGGDLGDLKKVTVASDSKKGLKAGLDKARQMMGEKGVLTDKDVERYNKK